MALIDIGVGSSDFTDNALADFGTQVTISRVTGTVGHMGEESVAYGPDAMITAVFHMRERTKVRTPEGVVEKAPAYLMTKASDTVSQDDRVTLQDGTSWKVWMPKNRDGIYVFSDLYLWDGNNG